MSKRIEERVIEVAHYIIDSKDTVRGSAKKFGVSKSTIHKDVSQRLEKINKAERHIRGGLATKKKYEKLKL